jgi:zinc D-Ala-D-Ala carboxypeptidase
MTEEEELKPGQITKNFYLSEFLASGTAKRKGYMEQYNPPDNIIDNIENLCICILQPLRDHLPNGIIRITSGYRCPRLNSDPEVRGKLTSQHLTGQAADIQYFEGATMNNQRIVETAIALDLKLDQCINENNFSWIHISYNEGHNRNQIFNLST